MFATRHKNENVIYEQQQAAAAKPLNQVAKGLAPKTPANKAAKTPFKIPLNDENAAFTRGKTGAKGKEGGLFGDGKGSKADQNAFVTPAGPGNRAPLGAKTTNAKATAFCTPLAPHSAHEKPSSVQATSPRLHRAKVKIHTAQEDALEEDAEEREIEYMPPREVPLPDYPDDCWPHDRTYPQFEGANLTRGWWETFRPRTKYDDEGSDAESTDEDEKVRRAVETKARKQREAEMAARQAYEELTKAPDTLKSHTAAAALSSVRTAKARDSRSFAAPTAATIARQQLAPRTTKSAAHGLSARGNTRFTAAKAASNTTLGYSKGRVVSATARQPLSEVHSKPVGGHARNSLKATMPAGRGSLVLQEADQSEDGLVGFGVSLKDMEYDEFADFQLDMPEDL
ncbi:hypothetical protein BAUCODRAFT_127197 [Baudoinia panamericana UAMH 10762]|uniref:Uncharacterized protein n=1 Tax=Baudoinia panamericana (strain UAMH 10762) TaxID=717646 RepID=M2M3Y4_BAUPA|nr:uncharacterized protein BAUCODRAFT_127197 [Baudoinia panamericana UAMH 10762]EMC91286.1 hypothetical protein BAUCODRAFT_127197 [Baudoinia panamericana UAMH 10762]